MRRVAGLLIGGCLLAVSASPVLPAGEAQAAWRQSVHRRHLPPDDPAALCEAAISRAEKRYATPPALLRAISLVETGRFDHGALRAWPWSVDVDGVPFFFPSRDGAAGFARTALLAGAHSVDVGCMQVNLESHPDAFATVDDGFDPTGNVDYATRFLVALHSGPAHLVWATAVGYYHSQTEAIALPYRARVIAIDNTILPEGALPLDPSTPPAHRVETAEDRMRKAWAATLAPAAAAGDDP